MRILFILAGFSVALPAAAQEALSFQTPSGNIHCVAMTGYGGDGMRCDMMDYTPSIPVDRPQDCDLDYGHAFWIGVGDAAGSLVCAGDTVLDPSHPVLDYGQSVTTAGITCTSAKTGLTCENASGHGFSLSRKAQSLF